MVNLAAEHISVVRAGRKLLDDVCVAFASPGATAIIGPNGAGKSTLLKTLAGLLAPTSGSVIVDGRTLDTIQAPHRAAMIGYMPQQFEPHWDIQLRDLVRISCERAVGSQGRRTPDDILAAHRIESLAEQRWSTLSGGERARALLSMVLAVDPPILLADEPAASLDPGYRLELLQKIAERGKAGICVTVMHDIDLAFRFFDQIVMLDAGRVVASGHTRDVYERTVLDDAFGVNFIRSQKGELRLINPGFLRGEGPCRR